MTNITVQGYERIDTLYLRKAFFKSYLGVLHLKSIPFCLMNAHTILQCTLFIIDSSLQLFLLTSCYRYNQNCLLLTKLLLHRPEIQSFPKY